MPPHRQARTRAEEFPLVTFSGFLQATYVGLDICENLLVGLIT